MARFPCLRLAYEALKAGGSASAVLNAANEVAVARFLAGDIGFTDIARLIAAVLARCEKRPLKTLDDVLEADRTARARADECLAELAAEGAGNGAVAQALSGAGAFISATRP
jgi:1-deoxy-D-xylulose-5-phosphate reductoisomerase